MSTLNIQDAQIDFFMLERDIRISYIFAIYFIV
jgi:hypothetical protein